MDKLMKDINSYLKMIAEGLCTSEEASLKIEFLITVFLANNNRLVGGK